MPAHAPQPLIGVLNGPNLDRLGRRQPEIYGRTTLGEIEAGLRTLGTELGVRVECFQSNHEGDLIDRLAAWADAGAAGFILNPGGLTHSSVVLRDALLGHDLPAVEVHLSNLYRREEFRQHSLTAPACVGVISGLGPEGYPMALRFLANRLRAGSKPSGGGHGAP